MLGATFLALLAPVSTGNVVVLVADDLGVDRIGAYAEHPKPGITPNVDRLAAHGVLFRNAWANPICSPTRATVLTGRYGFRTGVGRGVDADDVSFGLRLSEVTLPEALGDGYASAAVGKWHLGSDLAGPLHPNQSGFGTFAGSPRNLGGDQDYYNWNKTVNGVTFPVRTYATTDTADEAIAALAVLPEPWFLWVAFNAPHNPVHAPPSHLHDFDLSGPPLESSVEHYKAMVQAMDAEIGRILEYVDLQRTTVFFLGDNGTTKIGTDAPFDPDRAKGKLYEGGINVPLIVAGEAVPAQSKECAALVGASDIYATVLAIAGRPSIAEDSVSFLDCLSDPRAAPREFVYTERFWHNAAGAPPFFNHRQAIRDERYKLILRSPFALSDAERELFDLSRDPWEEHDLLDGDLDREHEAALERLTAALPYVAP